MTNFEFLTKNEKWRILGILDVKLREKNQKKYRTVLAVEPERTDAREFIRFLPESKDKLIGEN